MTHLIARWAETVHLSVGARRAAIAFLAGGIGALALPPVSFFPAMIVPMSVAIWLLDGAAGASRFQRMRSAAGAGWVWGFGYFVAGFHWLVAAFFVEPDKFAWLSPLGLFGLPAALALFPAAGFAAAAALWRPGGRRILIFAAALTLSEMARGLLFTGFPWNGPGMAFGAVAPLAQIASVVGLDGLTLLVTALCAAPATLAAPRQGPWARSPLALALVAFLAIGVFGIVRLGGPPTPAVAGVRLRLMQPNIAQNEKFRPAAGAAILRDYLTLSDRSTSPQTNGLTSATHLIWPESPFPFALAREPQALAQIATALAGKTHLLTGAIRLDGDGARARAYNSLLALDPRGTIIAAYDKTHLVPFGEYLPFGGLMRAIGLRQFIALPGGFEPGARHAALNVPGLPPALPLICYEAIFPYEVAAAAERSRPGLLVNVTNDGWFGNTAGPYQHLAQARLRAIELGLPLVRVANTGVSAIVDPFGRVTASLPLGVAGVLDGALPQAIDPTPFSRHYRWIAATLTLAFLFFGLIGRRR